MQSRVFITTTLDLFWLSPSLNKCAPIDPPPYSHTEQGKALNLDEATNEIGTKLGGSRHTPLATHSEVEQRLINALKATACHQPIPFILCRHDERCCWTVTGLVSGELGAQFVDSLRDGLRLSMRLIVFVRSVPGLLCSLASALLDTLRGRIKNVSWRQLRTYILQDSFQPITCEVTAVIAQPQKTLYFQRGWELKLADEMNDEEGSADLDVQTPEEGAHPAARHQNSSVPKHACRGNQLWTWVNGGC